MRWNCGSCPPTSLLLLLLLAPLLVGGLDRVRSKPGCRGTCSHRGICHRIFGLSPVTSPSVGLPSGWGSGVVQGRPYFYQLAAPEVVHWEPPAAADASHPLSETPSSSVAATRQAATDTAMTAAYACVCRDGYGGPNCARPPRADPSRPPPRPQPVRGGHSFWWLHSGGAAGRCDSRSLIWCSSIIGAATPPWPAHCLDRMRNGNVGCCCLLVWGAWQRGREAGGAARGGVAAARWLRLQRLLRRGGLRVTQHHSHRPPQRCWFASDWGLFCLCWR